MGCGVSRARSRAQARLERECQEEYGGQGQAPLTRYVSPASKNLITREGSFKVQEKIDHRAVGVSVSFAASFSSRSYSSHPHIVTSLRCLLAYVLDGQGFIVSGPLERFVGRLLVYVHFFHYFLQNFITYAYSSVARGWIVAELET